MRAPGAEHRRGAFRCPPGWRVCWRPLMRSPQLLARSARLDTWQRHQLLDALAWRSWRSPGAQLARSAQLLAPMCEPRASSMPAFLSFFCRDARERATRPAGWRWRSAPRPPGRLDACSPRPICSRSASGAVTMSPCHQRAPRCARDVLARSARLSSSPDALSSPGGRASPDLLAIWQRGQGEELQPRGAGDARSG